MKRENQLIGPSIYKTPRPLSSRIYGHLGALLIKCFLVTYRWRRVGEIPADIANKEPLAFIFWHNQELIVAKLFWKMKRNDASKGLVALASRHRDGQIIAQLVECFGFLSVAGSTTRGGLDALRLLRRVIEDGYDVAMAPDGPKGPPHQVKKGIVSLAIKHGLALIPLAYETKTTSAWRFNKAWDKMFLPKPFARISWAVGPAIRFGTEANLETAMQSVNLQLQNLNRLVANDIATDE